MSYKPKVKNIIKLEKYLIKKEKNKNGKRNLR